MDNPLALFCPYPTVDVDGTLYDGLVLTKSKFCSKKCVDRVCKHFLSRKEEGVPQFYTCPAGYSIAVIRIGDSTIRVNGIIETSSNTSKPHFKKRNKSRKAKVPELQAWFSALKRVRPHYDSAVEAKAKDAVHALHDIKSLIASIMKTSEEWISEQPGSSIDEQLQHSPENLRKIYQSCRVLESLLLITDILANPEVAKFGQRRLISIRSVLFLLTKIHEDKAQRSNRTIKLRGNSEKSARLYSSFIVIPHVLIDNAIKHSDPGSKIHIWVNDMPNGEIRVDISSVGRLIPKEEQNKIFRRGTRGSNVKVKGSGLGLFIAKIVAEANGLEVQYQVSKHILRKNKGINHFLFTVPAGASI